MEDSTYCDDMEDSTYWDDLEECQVCGCYEDILQIRLTFDGVSVCDKCLRSLMVKQESFKLLSAGSNPAGGTKNFMSE